MTADKEFMLRLSQVTRALDAGPTVMFLALTKCVFIEENPSHERIAQICNTTNRTLTRNAQKMAEIISQMIQVTPRQYVYTQDKMSTTPDNLSTLPDKMSTTLDNLSVDTLKEKGKERKKVFPPDPLYKEREEKGKERTSSSSSSSLASPATSSQSNDSVLIDPLVGDAFKPVLEEIAKSYVPGSDGMVTSGAAQPVEGEAVTLKYPNEFEFFYKAYPNRWGLAGVGYLRLKGYWKRAEEQGWTGPAIVKALKSADAIWQAERQANKKVFIPDADKFLTEETHLRRYLPAMEVAQMLGAPIVDAAEAPLEQVELAQAEAFEEFCSLYPKKRGLLDPKEKLATAKAWKGCEARGWMGGDILRALNEARYSKLWTDENGRYIPSAEKFLEEEQMRQFLPIGFQPRSSTPSYPSTESNELFELLSRLY